MTLIKTSLLNAIAVGIKMLTLLGINKILAMYIGPSGYAAIGQFQNAVQMISTLANGAINTGVTKYTAEHHENEAVQRDIWRTAGAISLISSITLSLVVIVFKTELALWLLNDATLAPVFSWFSATLVLFVINTLLLAILNGKKEIQRYVLASISGSLFSLIVTSLMVIHYGLIGALVALAIYQSLAFFATFALCLSTKWFNVKYLFGIPNKQILKNFAKYAAMALTTAATVPLSHILIRNELVNELGWEAAGYWEAMWRISTAYLMLVTTTLGVYYLPRLSELKTSREIKEEVKGGYKIILPIAATCSLLIYNYQDIIISILFTQEFAAMKVLFGGQMIGDTLKIGSWILAYIMLGRAMTKTYIATEIIFSATFYILTVYCIKMLGLEGVAVAHAVNYMLYWIIMIIIMSRALNNKKIASS